MVALVVFLTIVGSLVSTATSTVVRWFVDTPLAIHCECFTPDCSRTLMWLLQITHLPKSLYQWWIQLLVVRATCSGGIPLSVVRGRVVWLWCGKVAASRVACLMLRACVLLTLLAFCSLPRAFFSPVYTVATVLYLSDCSKYTNFHKQKARRRLHVTKPSAIFTTTRQRCY